MCASDNNFIPNFKVIFWQVLLFSYIYSIVILSSIYFLLFLWPFFGFHTTPQNSSFYGHLPPITKTIKVRRTRHTGQCRRSRDELISDVLLWTPSHGRKKVGRPARTYIQQLCADTGCSLVNLPEAMDDRVEWRKRVRDIRADGAAWWWWWWWLFSHVRMMQNFSVVLKKQLLFIKIHCISYKNIFICFPQSSATFRLNCAFYHKTTITVFSRLTSGQVFMFSVHQNHRHQTTSYSWSDSMKVRIQTTLSFATSYLQQEGDRCHASKITGWFSCQWKVIFTSLN